MKTGRVSRPRFYAAHAIIPQKPYAKLEDKKGWHAVMLLPSYRKWFPIGAMGLAAAVWGFGRPAQDAPQVTIAPRPKPAPKEEILPKSNIRSDVNLVLIPVTVTDPLNRFVTGLE